MVDDDLWRVKFVLEQDEDGWPPSTAETLWARKLDDGLYEIDNLPIYVSGIAYRDVIEAFPAVFAEQRLVVFRQVVRRSGHSLYRVFLSEPKDGRWDGRRARLESLGCGIESGDDRLFSIDVPPASDVGAVYDVLEEGLKSKYWDFEEAYYHDSSRKP